MKKLRWLRRIEKPLITTPQELRGAFSLWLGHRTGLTRHWRLIQYRADTSLPTKGEAMKVVASPDQKTARRDGGIWWLRRIEADLIRPVCELGTFPIVGKAWRWPSAWVLRRIEIPRAGRG